MNTVELTKGRRRALLATVLLGTLLGPLDSAVNIAFPQITQSFGIELKSIRWVVIVYVATYASLMLAFGRIGDVFGHVRVFAVGLVVCIIGFAACGVAQSFEWLLAARVLQGVGTAMVLSCGPALATNLFSEQDRPRILGAYAMMYGLGGAAGPSLGGFLVDLWGWSAVFWFRLPLAIAALAATILLRMPPPERDDGSFQLVGAVLVVASTGLFCLTFGQLEALIANPAYVLPLCALYVILIASFAVASRRKTAHLIDLRQFSNPFFAWSNLTNVVVNLAGFATMLFVPYFLVRASALPLWQGGLIMAIGAVGMMLASQLGGRMVTSVGAGRQSFIGAGLVALGLYGVSYWDAQTEPLSLIASLLVHGVGLGLFQVANLEIVTSSLPKSNRGVAGSLAFVMRTIGVVVAAGTLTIVFAILEEKGDASSRMSAFEHAFQSVFELAALGLAAYLLLSLAAAFVTAASRPGRRD